jgi:hypothetical protein
LVEVPSALASAPGADLPRAVSDILRVWGVEGPGIY